MSRKVYSEIYLHIVWRTKDSLPLITANIEKELYTFLKKRCSNTPGAFIYGIGGTQDHVHLCVSVPPTLLIADWIGEMKGSSSYHINQKFQKKSLQWQTGYGVVSFGKNNLDFVKQYIENQKEHHSSGKIHERLEEIESVED